MLPFSGHLTEWFGGSFNRSNTVEHRPAIGVAGSHSIEAAGTLTGSGDQMPFGAARIRPDRLKENPTSSSRLNPTGTGP